MKEYHLYMFFPDYRHIYETTVKDVENAIKAGEERIYTFQVVTCTTDLFRHGYRIFVHASLDDTYEIKLGMNDRTGREIKMGHCLYKLILAGEFEGGAA